MRAGWAGGTRCHACQQDVKGGSQTSGPPSGLPAELSSLVGRSIEIAAVLEHLRTARVVTLAGPGGCGKDPAGVGAELAARRSNDQGHRRRDVGVQETLCEITGLVRVDTLEAINHVTRADR